MEFTHLIEPALTASVDLIALVVHGDPSKDPQWRAFDSALGGALSEAAKAESFEGKPSQVLTIWTKGPLKAQRLLALGAGPRHDQKLPSFRDLGAVAGQTAAKLGATSLAFVLHPAGAKLAATVQLLVEGALLGSYKFARYLTGEDAKNRIRSSLSASSPTPRARSRWPPRPSR
jgi:leucyl aminopeptidase